MTYTKDHIPAKVIKAIRIIQSMDDKELKIFREWARQSKRY